MHVEDDTINFYHIIQNRNKYPIEDINCGDYSSMVIPDDVHFSDTIIPKNKYFSSNKMTESGYLVLLYLYIGGTK